MDSALVVAERGVPDVEVVCAGTDFGNKAVPGYTALVDLVGSTDLVLVSELDSTGKDFEKYLVAVPAVVVPALVAAVAAVDLRDFPAAAVPVLVAVAAVVAAADLGDVPVVAVLSLLLRRLLI